MFKNITINLSEPICSCNEQNLKWIISATDWSAQFICKTCNVKLTIPMEKLFYSFKLDKDYPGRQKEKIVKNKENNVVSLFDKNDEENK